MKQANHSPIPVIAFVGRSGCGKTTLLENIVPHLQARGIRLAVIKHTWHKGIVSDAEGTDTRKMWDSGVPSVVLVSADRVVHWQRHETEPALETVLEKVTGVDLIILEGFKNSEYPKIEVLRQAHHAEKLPDLKARVAFVTDRADLDTSLPCFALDDYTGIADFLGKFLIRKQT